MDGTSEDEKKEEGNGKVEARSRVRRREIEEIHGGGGIEETIIIVRGH